MQNPRLAGRYAKSLIVLAQEQNQLDQVYNDMVYLDALVKGSRDFANLLRSPVIKADKKQIILKAVTGEKLGTLTTAFNNLLINKGREAALPEIITAFIAQYKDIRGIYVARLVTAAPASEELKKVLVEKIKASTNLSEVELQTSVDESLIGGFRLEMGNTLVDASVAYDLNMIKKQFLNNDYLFNIR